MGIFLIGVDCAAKPENMGLAWAEFDGKSGRLLDVKKGSKRLNPVSQLCEWISEDSPTLIALDAPLGWPEGFGNKLARHQAGLPIKRTCLETFFNRETDRIVHKCVNKCKGNKPFEVGADKIARASFVALEILGKVRQNQKSKGQDISIAWTPEIQDVQAIEVYPAATLKMYGYLHESYKKNSDKEKQNREKILDSLSEHFPSGIKQCHRDCMIKKADALDAVVCILAAIDFLKGEARGPENDLERKRAEREGWIWFRRELLDQASSPETPA